MNQVLGAPTDDIKDEYDLLVRQGAPNIPRKHREARAKFIKLQPHEPCVCEDYHRAVPGLKRYRIRALEISGEAGLYVLAPDQPTAERIYTQAIAVKLETNGFTRVRDKDGEDTGAFTKPVPGAKPAGPVLAVTLLPD